MRLVYFLFCTCLVTLRLYTAEMDAVEFPVFDVGSLLENETYLFTESILWNDDAERVVVDASSGCECLVLTKLPEELSPGKDNRIEFEYRPNAVGSTRISILLHTVEPMTGREQQVELIFQAWVTTASKQNMNDLFHPEFLPEKSVGEIHENPFGVLLVDIRGGDAYGKMRIPGSIQMSLEELSVRKMHGEKELVLVDAGWWTEADQQHVQKLQRDGLVISRVKDGFPGWVRSGGEVEGSWISKTSIRKLPLEIWSETAPQPWRVIYLGKEQPAFLKMHWGNTVIHHPLGDQLQHDEQTVTKLMEEAIKDPESKAILLIGTDQQYTRVEAVIGRHMLIPCYYLEGGGKHLGEVLNARHQPETTTRSVRIASTRSTGAPAPGIAGNNSTPGKGRCSTCPGK